MNTLYLPQLLYSDGTFISNRGLLVDEDGKIVKLAAQADSPLDKVIELPGKALMPGFVNAHSHSFQRLIRGKSGGRCTTLQPN